MDTFDIIIVGAGSAGCVLADRLSADGRRSVLVVEAGGHDRRLWVKLPIGYGRSYFDRRVNWGFEAEPDPGLDGRRAYWPRGKIVGGSSSINALVYCRGLPQDFDDWQASGATGWGWDDVRPVFERFEQRIDAVGRATGEGPLTVADVTREVHPIGRHFFAAAAHLGLPASGDFNGPAPEGVGVYAITRHRGLRCSSADAFLRPALRRPTVTLATEAHVRRIVIEQGRAVGIDYETRGAVRQARARGCVILSAGAIGSPHLLQLSGIGPADVLRRHGVAVRLDRPRVGAGLQDHLAVTYGFRSRAATLNEVLRPWHGKFRAAFTYATTRRGPLGLSVNQYGGFVRSRADSARADLQLYFNPLTYTWAMRGGRRTIVPDPFPGFILSYQPARPTSRGWIEIASADPFAAPRIHPNSLSTETDRADVVAGGRLLQALAATPALRSLSLGPIGADLAAMDDAALLADFRTRGATVYHPVGTCRMGSDPETSVVDPGLRVRGIDGLRVVDASVFPSITSGNTNAPTLMVAHKAADLIRRDLDLS